MTLEGGTPGIISQRLYEIIIQILQKIYIALCEK